MNGSFNGQILVDKLVKLNNTQQSIETLSHWCIFHRNKAKLVVETWERQFCCAPRDQRICFLYLANDILQNSRRKGLEFINEFWKVLPGALIDVHNNGGDFGKNTVLRLVDIWEERKVFGSRGQVLKDDILGRNKNEKGITYKLKQPDGALLEKIISGYNQTDAFPFNEDVLFGNCQASVNFIEKAKGQGNDWNSNGSEGLRELQRHRGVLQECIEQLKAIESSRTSLVAYLREALHEQESKIEQVRQQLQFAQSGYQQSVNLYEQLNISSSTPEQRESSALLNALPNLIPEPAACAGSQATTVRYTREAPPSDNNVPVSADGNRKTASATLVGQLASSSSSEMFTYKLSSLSSDGVVAHTNKEDLSSDNKRMKLDDNAPSHLLPTQPHLHPPLPPLPPFLHPDFSNQPPPLQPPSPVMHPRTGVEPPPPPPSFPPTPPPPPPPPVAPAAPQFIPIVSGSTAGMPFGYGPPPPYPNYTMLGLPPYPGAFNPYHGFQAPEGVNHVGQPPLPTAPP